MKTTKHNETWLNGKQHLWAGLALLFILISVFSFAQKPVQLKIVKIVDGDTVTIEKSMEEFNVEDFTKQFQNINGKNVQVMVSVDADDKDKKKSKSASSMHFNFDIDSSMANAFSKCFMFSDSTMCRKFVWHDSLMKGLAKDFNFNFNFDEEEIMKDFDFDFNIDTKEDGKTVISRKNGGNTIVINGDEQDVTVDKSDSENGNTRTTTKTIVINDDKTKTKKKVIVSTSVVVVDMDEENEKSKKRKGVQPAEEIMENFSFYPNPSDGNFILDLDLNGKEDALIRITDMNGKEVYSEKIKGNGKTTKTVNVGNERKGTFIVTIKQGKRTSSKKIIIE